jgi:adenylylsulfate kinase
LTAFISPYVSDRQLARELHEKHSSNVPFIEVFVDAPLSVVESRDPKGLYKKARAGEIKGEFTFILIVWEGRSWLPEFTGVSAPYEAPPNPEIHIKTDEVDVKGAVEIICKYLVEKNIIPA